MQIAELNCKCNHLAPQCSQEGVTTCTHFFPRCLDPQDLQPTSTDTACSARPSLREMAWEGPPASCPKGLGAGCRVAQQEKQDRGLTHLWLEAARFPIKTGVLSPGRRKNKQNQNAPNFPDRGRDNHGCSKGPAHLRIHGEWKSNPDTYPKTYVAMELGSAPAGVRAMFPHSHELPVLPQRRKTTRTLHERTCPAICDHLYNPAALTACTGHVRAPWLTKQPQKGKKAIWNQP
jgi:hypothetical protein